MAAVLGNLPRGFTYYAKCNEILVSIPSPEAPILVLTPGHGYRPQANNKIFGRWKVCDDKLHVQSGDRIKRIDELIREYEELRSVLLTVDELRANDPSEIKKRQWENVKAIALFIVIASLVISILIASIIVGNYGPTWIS